MFKMIHIGHHRPRGTWHVPPHKHETFEIIVVTSGHEQVIALGKEMRAVAGDVLLFKPGVVHREWGDDRDPQRSYHMLFTVKGDTSEWPMHLVDSQGHIRMLSAMLLERRDSVFPDSRRVQAACFDALMLEFIYLSRHSEGDGEDPMVASIRRFVRTNISAPLSVGLLAQQVEMSKCYFIRRYRALTGRSPMEDVRGIRLAYARDLILTSERPLKVIATMAGLADETALYRMFRRYMQITPGQVRRSVASDPRRRAADPSAWEDPAVMAQSLQWIKLM